MTALSKERRRIDRAANETQMQRARAAVHRTMPGFLKLWDQAHGPRPMRVTTTGVSVRAGVGGRKHRARRRARCRVAAHPQIDWQKYAQGFAYVAHGELPTMQVRT